MGKHAAPAADPRRRPMPVRLVVGLGVLLGLIASGVTWALIGSFGGTPAPLGQPSASVSPSGWALETAGGLGTGSPSLSPTPGPTDRPAPGRQPTSAVTARLVIGDTWRDGFAASVELVNRATTVQSWQVRLVFPGGVTVPDEKVWNATKQGTKGTILFSGGPLQPGARLVFGFAATKRAQNPAGFEPDECTVNGAHCTGF